MISFFVNRLGLSCKRDFAFRLLRVRLVLRVLTVLAVRLVRLVLTVLTVLLVLAVLLVLLVLKVRLEAQSNQMEPIIQIIYIGILI